MTNSQALVMGIIQGLTEYLPISSSAHMLIFSSLMGWQFLAKESFIFGILVQLGTLVGIFVYFASPLKNVIKSILIGLLQRKPFYNEDARLGWSVAIASIPAALVGFSFKKELSLYFSSPRAACLFLIFTGLLLFVAERFSKAYEKPISKGDAILIGMMQSLALFPGISRSGSTISAGLLCGLDRRKAVQFSFFLSIPVMLGAGLLALSDFIAEAHLINSLLTPLLLGFMSAALSGYLVIRWFMGYISHHKLYGFSLYCLIVGMVGAIYFSF